MATATQPAQRRAPKTGRTHSSVFKKSVMAVSGIVMVLFLVAHAVGNLHVFQGAASFNDYSEWLREFGEPALPYRTFLTLLEIGLLVAVLAHMWSAFALWKQAKRARPVAYVTKKRVQQSYSSRTLRWGGVIIALFIVWHLLDMTFGAVNPEGTSSTPYDRLIASFENPFITAFYVLALVLLGMHLRHGIFSAAQTLGQTNQRRERLLNVTATTFATGLIALYLVTPVAVAFNFVN